MKLALVMVATLGMSSVYAAPYYVGENLKTPNLINLNYAGTPVKEKGTRAASFLSEVELRGAYSADENTTVRMGLPFFLAPKDLTGTSKNTFGNVSLGGTYNWAYTTENKAWNYGFALTGDIFLPTSRSTTGSVVALANPTTDLFKYAATATSATPTVGAWISGDMVTAKANLGYGYSFVSSPTKLDGHSDKNRGQILGQLAASWNALPNLNANLEYNAIVLDSPTKHDTISATANGKAWRHAIVPSVSGNYDQVLAQVYATVPLDSTTRDVTNVAFGLNAGYTF